MKMHSSHTYPWNDTFFRSLFNSCNKVLNSTSTKSAVSASRWVEGINELLDGKEQFQTRTEKLIPELRNLRDEEIDDVYRYSPPQYRPIDNVYRYMSKQPWNLDQKVQHFSNLFPQKERNTKIY